MGERWHDSKFQISYATDENDLDFVIAVFRVGTHIDKEENDPGDRIGTTRGIWERWHNMMAVEAARPCTYMLETYSVTNGKPTQIRQNRRGVTKTRFLRNN